MALNPEDVHEWEVNDELVREKLEEIWELKNGKILKGIYSMLRLKLNTYPPDQKFYSIPRIDLHGIPCFWVKSENSQIVVRAKYYASHELCIIDKVLLHHELPEDFDL